jgi:hypothetical protein
VDRRRGWWSQKQVLIGWLQQASGKQYFWIGIRDPISFVTVLVTDQTEGSYPKTRDCFRRYSYLGQVSYEVTQSISSNAALCPHLFGSFQWLSTAKVSADGIGVQIVRAAG